SAEIGNTQRHARKIPVSPYLCHRRLVRPHVSPESGREGAATSLAALFTEWTRGFAADIIFYADDDKCLHVGDDSGEPFDMIIERAPDLDPAAFPEPIADMSLLRAWQRECGVDMDRIEDPEAYSQLQDTIDSTRRSLGL
ncbi:hypothetical protein, partial [Spirillospora sp. NPDC048819]|uniref:hypothetical protein n=1 Tax=Spirillospora sp. NPDC048819 TaxID=3155268 RepID=UPI0033FBDE08